MRQTFTTLLDSRIQVLPASGPVGNQKRGGDLLRDAEKPFSKLCGSTHGNPRKPHPQETKLSRKLPSGLICQQTSPSSQVISYPKEQPVDSETPRFRSSPSAHVSRSRHNAAPRPCSSRHLGLIVTHPSGGAGGSIICPARCGIGGTNKRFTAVGNYWHLNWRTGELSRVHETRWPTSFKFRKSPETVSPNAHVGMSHVRGQLLIPRNLGGTSGRAWPFRGALVFKCMSSRSASNITTTRRDGCLLRDSSGVNQ